MPTLTRKPLASDRNSDRNHFGLGPANLTHYNQTGGANSTVAGYTGWGPGGDARPGYDSYGSTGGVPVQRLRGHRRRWRSHCSGGRPAIREGRRRAQG
jgi:hypothetical protein